MRVTPMVNQDGGSASTEPAGPSARRIDVKVNESPALHLGDLQIVHLGDRFQIPLAKSASRRPAIDESIGSCCSRVWTRARSTAPRPRSRNTRSHSGRPSSRQSSKWRSRQIRLRPCRTYVRDLRAGVDRAALTQVPRAVDGVDGAE